MSKYVYVILAVVLIFAFALAGCERAASSPTLPTATLETAPLTMNETAEDPMGLLYQYATQTAMYTTPQPEATINALTGSETPGGVPITPGAEVTPTATSVLPPTGIPGTQTTPFVTPGAAITQVIGRPATYTLQAGEYPYCIARRFNVDPEELLAINGLTDGELFAPGLVLTIPQTGNPFPEPRALRTHPATYTVSSAEDTIYKIACYYGDVDPAQIASNNGLTPPYTLTSGQTLNVP